MAETTHKNYLKFAAAVVLGVLLAGGMAEAKDYRIDSQAAFDRLSGKRFAPGDRVLFERGRSFRGSFEATGRGTEGKPIVLKAYGRGDRPAIHAGGEHKAALQLRNVEWWEVSGLEVTNTDGSDTDQGDLMGIYVVASNPADAVLEHVYIRDCDVHDVNGHVGGKKRGGIHVHVKGEKPARFHDLRIEDNTIRRVGGVGIGNASPFASPPDDEAPERSWYWTGVRVRGNHIDHTGRNNIIARASRDAVYEHNTLANSSRHSTGHSIFCFNTIGIRIQFNEAYGNVGDEGSDRGGFDADWNCRDTYIQYNYSHNNEWFCGIMKRWNKGVVVRYNLSVNEREGLYFYGFDHAEAAEGIHVYNNTHYVGPGRTVHVFPEGRTPINTLFENNVFIFEGGADWGAGFSKRVNTVFDNNVYVGIDPPKEDGNAQTVDPQLVNPGQAPHNIDWGAADLLSGYRVRRDSPARDRGKVIKDAGGQDLWGNPLRDGKPDLGASEVPTSAP